VPLAVAGLNPWPALTVTVTLNLKRTGRQLRQSSGFWNLATSYIEGFFDIEAFNIEGFFDIEAFNIEGFFRVVVSNGY
jgi:hypothetical protein